MRALLLLGLAGAVAGCIPVTDTNDFIEMHGYMADGSKFDRHLPATTGIVPSAEPGLSMVTAVGAQSSGPETLRGFHIEWMPTLVQSGQTYPSSPTGPALFFSVGPDLDGGSSDENALLAVGSITFQQVSNDSKARVKGSVSDLEIRGRDGAPILSIGHGTFQATQP